MKTIMRGLTLAAVLLTAAVTQAEFVVLDDFTTGTGSQSTTPIRPTQTGNRQFFKNNSVASMVASVATVGPDVGKFVINYGTGDVTNREGTLSETFNAAQDFHSSNFREYLNFGFEAVGAGQVYDLVVTATDGVDLVSVSFLGLTGNGNFAVAGSQFGNGQILSNVTQLTFAATAKNNVAGSFFKFTALTAVPEPATMSLLGLTAIGGIFAHRRRKNQLAA